MTDDRSDLLDAVDELTLVTHTRERQEITRDGKARVQTVIVTQQPLLKQLDDAIRSSMGGVSTSGASLPSERSALDNDALFKFIRIETTIRDWCRAWNTDVTKNPVTDLRAWYTSTLAHTLEPAVESFYLKTIRGWAGTIRAKLDPWREKELPQPCPVCGASEWWRDGQRYFHPLIVRYKPDDTDMIQHAKGVCRACEHVWNARELAYALEQVEEEHAAPA